MGRNQSLESTQALELIKTLTELAGIARYYCRKNPTIEFLCKVVARFSSHFFPLEIPETFVYYCYLNKVKTTSQASQARAIAFFSPFNF